MARFRLAFGLGAVAVLSACQTHDFEPVRARTFEVSNVFDDVEARRAKPNLMLLVDKSGSMDLPVDPTNAACPTGCGLTKGGLCTPSCPTRWSQLQGAMDTFLRSYGTVARLGMMAFPADSSCGAPSTVGIELSTSNDLDAELQLKADEINAAVQRITSNGSAGSMTGTGGGTPISPSLRVLEGYEPLQDSVREDLVLLLTDGLPNCNSSNVNTCQSPAACRCTLASGDCSQYCALGCLDQSGTVSAVAALRAREVKTIVVGFGADTAQGDGPMVLSALAQAGDFRPKCGTDAECGGAPGSCELSATNSTCRPRFYQAANGAELAAALAAIAESIDPTPCEYELVDPPADERMLSVSVDDEAIASGIDTWRYSNGWVLFQGALCAKLEASTPVAPVRVHIQVLKQL